VAELAGPPPVPVEGLADFLRAFSLDADATSRLGGNRLAHMDEAGIDIQVVSHGNGSPSTLRHPEAVELCRRVNNDLATQIAEHPDRFRGFATLPLYDPAADGDERRRCV
jgi:predicted TIM-barrel fold metal-dependent hydrolase